MRVYTTERTNVRPSTDRAARVIAIVAIAAAIFALIAPVAFSGPRAGSVNAIARTQAASVPNSKPADGERSARFFGFLEFDWDPAASGGVPGFDPWPQTPQHP